MRLPLFHCGLQRLAFPMCAAASEWRFRLPVEQQVDTAALFVHMMQPF